MIFKSLGRKDKSFNQLYDYMKKGTTFEDLDLTFSHNIFSKERDEILREFNSNAQFLNARKNGNYFYHDILSISRKENSLNKKYQKEALLDLTNTYIKNRAPDCLVYGFIHDEKDNNLHIHLMISANEYQKTNRFRLEKKDFQKAKEITESKCLAKYKDLEQDKIITKDRTYKNDKEKLIIDFEYNSSYASSKEELKELMLVDGYEYYSRGNTDGFRIIQTKKNHRLKTLGVKDQFNKLPDLALKKPHVFKEWVMGDFSERDDNIRKQKSEGVKQKIKDTKERSEQTTVENIKETGKEWLMGDFKNRDYREQKTYKKTKPKEDSIVGQFVFGDFSQGDKKANAKHYKDNESAKNTNIDKEQLDKEQENKLDKWKENNNIPLSKKEASISSVNDRKEEIQKIRTKASKSRGKEKGNGMER